jgi:hypothetical protein
MKYWLGSGNRKYKKYGSQLLTFGLPAFRSKTGKKVCVGAGNCVLGCYAQQGRYQQPHIKKAQERRYAMTRRPGFVEKIAAELRKRKPRYVRIHDSGDFYSLEYLRNWLEIIRAFPKILFFTYTKTVPFFREISDIPKNFAVVFSEGGRWDHRIDRKTERHARVFATKQDLEAAGYSNGSEDDIQVILTGNPCIGLVYHGFNSRKFTTGG